MARISGSALWGWKDPRTTILLPFWQMLIPNLRFVIGVRNPLEVARSLRKRDGMSIGAGAYLWYRYTRAGVRDTRIIHGLLACTKVISETPSASLTGSPSLRFGKTRRRIRCRGPGFKNLRHQTSDSLELLDEVDIPLEYKLFYLGLRQCGLMSFLSTSMMTQVGTNNNFARKNIATSG